MWKRMRWLFWILFAILLAYIGVSVYFMEHFFLGTTVNGRKVELQTTEQVGRLVLQEADGYELLLREQSGQTKNLNAEELGVSFYLRDSVKQIKRLQNGFLWPRMFWKKDTYDTVPDVRFEEGKLTEVIQGLDWLGQGEEPENAWVEMTADGYVVHKEKQGTQIDAEMLKKQIREAVSKLSPELDLLESGCYKMPGITEASEEITSLKAELDEWLAAEITYQFGPESEVVDRKVISGFVELDGYEASISPEKVQAWVAQLAEERDTYQTKRKFKSTLRGTIEINGGSTGWQINQESESAELLAHVEHGEQLTKEPAYLRTGNPWSDNYDIGATYIEIDLTAQHMWLYKEGTLVIETDVVTGNMRRGYDTPEMVASIKYKARNAVLRGEGYASPVKYWMPFYGNYGIHDASWRSNFGGKIYLTNGSHGCVNTPRDAMQVIFENVEKGTPVVLYY